MAPAAQVTANRLNAQHSNGPRTPEGKRRASANSLKTGFCSTSLVIPEEMRAVFEEFRAGLLKSTAPQNAIEEHYYRRMLLSGWNLIRVQDAEAEAVIKNHELARIELLARYRRDLERSYDRALKALRELQRERIARASAEPAIRAALQAQAPLAVPPPQRRMTSAEMRAIVEEFTAPPIPRNEANPAIPAALRKIAA